MLRRGNDEDIFDVACAFWLEDNLHPYVLPAPNRAWRGSYLLRMISWTQRDAARVGGYGFTDSCK